MLSENTVFWIHTLYEISGIILGIGILLTFFQLIFLKKDMVTRSKRSSAEQSIAYMEMYSKEILNTHGIPGKVVGSVAYQKQLLEKKKDESLNVDGSHFFDKYYKEHEFDYPLIDKTSDEFQDAFWRIESDLVTVLNLLEIFSVAMMKGVADEKITFVPLSNHFCSFVKKNYMGICKTREQVPYENLVELFKKWNSRIEHAINEKETERLKAEAKELEKNAAVLKTQSKGTKPL